MTRAMRWRVGAFTIVGTVALGASFVGCGGDDDDGTVTPDQDSGVDTNPGVDSGKDTATGDATDSATTETATDSGDAGDTAPPPADRQVTIVFGQPDTPATGLFVCLGAFAGDPAAATAPTQAIGPAGVPDTTAPTDPTKYKGFGFGSVLPFPVSDPAAKVALTSLTVVAYFLEANPLTMTPASTCKDQWATVKGDTKRWFSVAANTIKAGESHVLALHGCKNPTATNAAFPGVCGTATADSRDFVLSKLDTAALGTGATFKSQFLHLSEFAGVSPTVPSFQNVEIYLQGMTAATTTDAGTSDGGDGGDAADASDAPSTPTPTGAPILIAGDKAGAAGVKYLDLGPAVNVTLPGDKNEALFLIVPHGTDPCFSGATCATVKIPAKPYLDAYKAAGGGFAGQQLIWLLGGLVPPTGTTTPKVIFGLAPTKLF